jgi:hypothetical protein
MPGPSSKKYLLLLLKLLMQGIRASLLLKGQLAQPWRAMMARLLRRQFGVVLD